MAETTDKASEKGVAEGIPAPGTPDDALREKKRKAAVAASGVLSADAKLIEKKREAAGA